MEKQQVHVLIVDDSALMRRALRALFEHDPQIVVVGEAANGREALDHVAELRPDVITMDVRMPVMDGLETTERLMAYYPTPILVITASLSSYDIDITFQMLGAGALDVIEKPRLTNQGRMDHTAQELVRRVKAVSRMRVVTHLRGRRRSAQAERLSWRIQDEQAVRGDVSDGVPRLSALSAPVMPALPAHIRDRAGALKQPARRKSVSALPPLVIIGASAGGPRVVYQILSRLPRPFNAAIVIVQHIAEGFGSGMADWLAGTGTVLVRLAREGMQLEVDCALVAPDSVDLMIESDGTVHLNDEPLRQQRPRPSVDIAMQSAAAAFGSYTIGVVLTGMGQDGAIGMQHIKRAGGATFAQNEASAPIYGMPRAAVELGVVDAVLAPEEIVIALQRRVTDIWDQMSATPTETG
jgi:two-component system chemotaxis response regulator CheB